MFELAGVSNVPVVVLRMSRVTVIDASGAAVLADAIEELEGRGITVMISGMRSHQERILSELGAYERLASDQHLFESDSTAIAHARVHAARRQAHGSF